MLNQDSYAGITVHIVDEGIDTGGIIVQEKVPIEDKDTYGLLQSKLAYVGAKLATKVLKILSYGTIIPTTKQDEALANNYVMPTAKELTINWLIMDANQIVRLINACNPWNKGAGTSINNWILGITAAEIVGDLDIKDTSVAGTIICCNSKEGLQVKTKDNKKLKINILYTNEGFFTGEQMIFFGLTTGQCFS
jgi:methionyl-tRNA formyltransferase